MVQDGQLIAAAEEERFARVKHIAGFPTQAIRFCISASGIDLGGLETIAVSRNPWAHVWRKIPLALRHGLFSPQIRERLSVLINAHRIRQAVAQALEVPAEQLGTPVAFVEHHRAHMASSFYPSGWEEAAVLSLDGFGDFVSGMWGVGRGNQILVEGQVYFPHSLGVLYTALTQFLGFPEWGDEYKVMGLAAYGHPERYRPAMEKLVWETSRHGYALDLEYFRHPALDVSMTWREGAPKLGTLFSDRIEELLGRARMPGEPLEDRHADIAAALQERLEAVVLPLLRHLHQRSGLQRLCYAGGVALNCVLNGKILLETGFQEVFIQPAAHDAGTSLGAALYVTHHLRGRPRRFVMRHAAWGPDVEESVCRQALEKAGLPYRRYEPQALCEVAAEALSQGKIIGWFQGRMEFGPRALGHRSLLADPRDPQMKDRINERVKRREPFRPFAPSILAEKVPDYFSRAHPDPFMLFAYPVKPDSLKRIPAVVHVDGTGRLQAVDAQVDPLYGKLLRAFGARTSIPVLLNTSFNEQEPIVCRPEEAISCFLRNGIDSLALGPFWIQRER